MTDVIKVHKYKILYTPTGVVIVVVVVAMS